MASPKPPPKLVALAVNTEHVVSLRVAQGVLDYARAHADWRLLANPRSAEIRVGNLSSSHWDGDGIIGVVYLDDDPDCVQDLKTPLVCLNVALESWGLQSVRNDHYAIGRMAGQHLLSCGFERFAYVGIKLSQAIDLEFSNHRLEGLADAVAPHPVQSFHLIQDSLPIESLPKELDAWLLQLEYPIGMLVVYDGWARAVIDTCIKLGIRVPEDIAVVGIDDNEVQCLYGSPEMSSVRPAWRRNGYEAARVLDQLMQGTYDGPKTVLIPPERVVQRDSTAVSIYSDPFITQAHRYIRMNIGDSLGVDQIADALNVQRRWLERNIKTETGLTPQEFIHTLKINHAKVLLHDTDRSIKSIAADCGFWDPKHFRAIFRRHTDQTPTSYRQGLVHVSEHSGG